MSDETLFAKAVAIPGPAERAAFLDRECAGRPDLRREVEELLAAHDRAEPGFLRPVADPRVTLPCPSHPPQAAPEAGTLLAGRYKLVEVIGEGGMGTVWMAQQTEPVRRAVAVKLIKAGMDSRAVLARFETERQAHAMMDHPNIAKVLDAGAAPDGRPYFVMELVKGLPITRYCDEHRLTVRERLELFVPVCQAIQHAHQKGVIHRDIKPSNVLVAMHDDKPVPVVIDFGVAKALWQQLTEHTLATGFGKVIGTPEYMSPEQASFNQLDVDTRSDVFALGILLYELLAGSPPFSRKELEAAGVLEILRVIREREPLRPSTKLSTAEGLAGIAANRNVEPKRLTGQVRGELDWIVMKALEKDRNRRYETANSFARDVERYLNNQPVEACPPTLGYRLRKFWSRHRAGVVVGAVAAVLVLAIIALGVYGYDQRHEAELARERVAAAEERTELEKDFRAREELRAKLELAWARVNDPVYNRQEEVRRVLTNDVGGLLAQIRDAQLVEALQLEARSIYARTFAVPDFAPHRPTGDILELAEVLGQWPIALHPSGKSMVIGTPGDPIHWVRCETLTIPPEYRPGQRLTANRLPKLAYSPKGTYLVYAPWGGGVQVWDSRVTRRLGELKDAGPGQFLAFAFDAAESTLWACRSDGHFRSWSVPGFTPTSPWRVPDPQNGTVSAAAFDPSGKLLAIGTGDGKVHIVDGEGKTVRTIRGSNTSVDVIAWSEKSDLIAAGFMNAAIRVWESSGVPLRVFRTNHAHHLAFHPTHPWLFVGASGDAPAVFDLGSGLQLLAAANSSAHNFSALSADGTTIAGANGTSVRFGAVLIPSPVLRELTGHEMPIDRLRWCADSRHFVTLDMGFEARIWNVGQPRPVFRIELPAGGYYAQNGSVALSHNARYLAYAGGGPTQSPVRVYDIATGAVVVEDTLPGGFEVLVAAGDDSFMLVREQFDPGKRTLSTVLWDVAVGKKPAMRHVVRPSEPTDDRLYFSSRVSPDGRYLAWNGPRYSNAGHRLEVREVQTGRLVHLHPWVKSVLNDEGPGFAFNVEATQLVLREKSAPLIVRSIPLSDKAAVAPPTVIPDAVSPKGRWWLGANPAGGLRREGIAALFRTGESRAWLTFAATPSGELHFNDERSAFSPDGQYLAAGSSSGTVTLIQMPTLEREIDAYDKLLRSTVRP